jgi:pimeloyl-ACP methyl ester carboxylesterase
MTPTSFIFYAPNTWETENAGSHGLEVLAWNPEESHKPTLLCVHGLTRNAHDFDRIAPVLSEHFRVYALSMAGRGGSTWLDNPLNYHYGTYINDCLSFIMKLGVTSVAWLGTSMGGIIGMSIAAAHPSLITSLTINDIGAVVPASALARIYEYASVAHVFDTREACESYLREVMQPWGVPDDAWAEIFSHSIITKDGKFMPACDPEILASLKVSSENFTKAEDIDLRAVWEKVTCPVLLLHGAQSDILPRHIADEMAQKDGVTLIRYEGIGHAPALMDTQQIAQVADWFKST